MGKTFRKNEGHRPKWYKRGNKSRKLREFEEDKFKYRPQPLPLPSEPDSIDFSELPDEPIT